MAGNPLPIEIWTPTCPAPSLCEFEQIQLKHSLLDPGLVGSDCHAFAGWRPFQMALARAARNQLQAALLLDPKRTSALHPAHGDCRHRPAAFLRRHSWLRRNTSCSWRRWQKLIALLWRDRRTIQNCSAKLARCCEKPTRCGTWQVDKRQRYVLGHTHATS